ELGDPDAALKDCDHAARVAPESAGVWYTRGVALARLGRRDEGLASNYRAIPLDRDDPLAWLARGNCRVDPGVHRQALADPDNARALFNRGVAWHALGEYRSALADYGEAIRLAPHEAGAYVNRGATSAAMGAHADAVADYARDRRRPVERPRPLQPRPRPY